MSHWGGPEDQVWTVKPDSGDCALEEQRAVRLADEVHQHARNGHDDVCKVKRPASAMHVRLTFTPLSACELGE